MQMVHGSNSWNQLCKIDNYKILSKLSSLWYKNSARFKWKSYCCLISYDCYTQSLWPASIDGYTIRVFARKEESHGTFSMYLSCQTTPNQLLGNLWIVILIFLLLRGNYPGMFSALPLFAHQTRALRLISYEANFSACSHCLPIQYLYSAQQIHSPVAKSQLSPTVGTLNTDDFFLLRHHLNVWDILPLHKTFSCHRWTIHLRQHHL